MVDVAIPTLVLGTDAALVASRCQQLAGAAGVHVIARAEHPEGAIRVCQRQAPRVALLCVAGPADLQLLGAVLGEAPLPVVAITATPALGLQALQSGATEVLADQASTDHIVESLRLMSQVRVIRPRGGPSATNTWAAVFPARGAAPKTAHRARRVVALGASTGGPQVLREILRALPREGAQSTVIAQHMPRDFHPSFCEWLQSSTGQQVEVARQGEQLQSGVVWLAPGDADLEVSAAGDLRLRPIDRSGPVPSIDTLFRSLTQLRGADICAVLLTGMGRDGAAGLRALRDVGAFTLVQSRHTSVVPSMPETALSLGAADLVLSPASIAAELLRWIQADNAAAK